MKNAKRITAVLLCAAMIFGCAVVPTYANEDVTSSGKQRLYTVLNKVVDVLVTGITAVIPSPRWEKLADYEAPCFFEGKGDFSGTPAEGAKWSVGYANASLQDGNELDGEHYIGGSLTVGKKTVLEVLDDQKARTVAISDGSGINIFSVLDAYGLPNAAVQEIRVRFMKEAEKRGYDIESVNVSVLHQHSCVDTFGMNGNIISALFLAPINNILGRKNASGQNDAFMEHLYNTVSETMLTAIDNMETGKLYFGSVDVDEYIRDKRDVQVYDSELHRIRFVPDNEGSKETWFVNGAIHCVGFGASTRGVTADYPYFMEEYINKNENANFMYIQGAELAISSQYGENLEVGNETSEIEGDSYARLIAYGKVLASKVCSISDEVEVAPALGIAFKQVIVKIKNPILVFAAKFGLLTNTVLRDGLGYCIPTEVGYCELGNSVAIAIAPGELAPEIAFGGTMKADDELNWSGEDWGFEPMQSVAGDKEFIVFGLTNDQIGYILADNDYHSYFTENEEIVSSGPEAGSTITKAFFDLTDSVLN